MKRVAPATGDAVASGVVGAGAADSTGVGLDAGGLAVGAGGDTAWPGQGRAQLPRPRSCSKAWKCSKLELAFSPGYLSGCWLMPMTLAHITWV